jgi:hypothetical protein
MLWIFEHRNVWRGAILVVMLVAIVGPWTFDVIWVPSEYPCSAPFVRLDNDFCGIPLTGIRLFRWMVEGLVQTSAELVTGAMPFIEWTREFLFGLLLFLPVLPFFSTLLLILRGDRRRRQVFNVAAWSLAGGVGLLLGTSSHPRLFWVLRGIWLYIELAASALILEVLTLAAGRRPAALNRGEVS